MGPPLSPRETRRSGRRSVPSASTSTSQSPPPESATSKDKPTRPSLSASNSNGGRNKRPKQEDSEESVIGHKNPPSNAPKSNHNNGRAKRKGKEKERHQTTTDPTPESAAQKAKHSVSSEEPPLDPQEDEEQGITRCVCGSTGACPFNKPTFISFNETHTILYEEDDPDAGEFMVQCETCKVWQHGLCMGYESEDQLHDDDYYCEECRPELHQDLIKFVVNILLFLQYLIPLHIENFRKRAVNHQPTPTITPPPPPRVCLAHTLPLILPNHPSGEIP